MERQLRMGGGIMNVVPREPALLGGIKKAVKKVGKTVKKKQNTQENLDNLTTGRKTVKTLFKTQDDTGKMVSKIENVSKMFKLIVSSQFRVIKKSRH